MMIGNAVSYYIKILYSISSLNPLLQENANAPLKTSIGTRKLRGLSRTRMDSVLVIKDCDRKTGSRKRSSVSPHLCTKPGSRQGHYPRYCICTGVKKTVCNLYNYQLQAHGDFTFALLHLHCKISAANETVLPAC